MPRWQFVAMQKFTDMETQIQAGVVPYGVTVRKVVAREQTAQEKADGTANALPYTVYCTQEVDVYGDAIDPVEEVTVNVSAHAVNKMRARIGEPADVDQAPTEPE